MLFLKTVFEDSSLSSAGYSKTLPLICYDKSPEIGSRKLRSLIHGISCIRRMRLRTRQEHIMKPSGINLFLKENMNKPICSISLLIILRKLNS